MINKTYKPNIYCLVIKLFKSLNFIKDFLKQLSIYDTRTLHIISLEINCRKKIKLFSESQLIILIEKPILLIVST